LNGDLVAIMHKRRIGRYYKQKQWQHGHRLSLTMSIDRELMISRFASSVIHHPNGCLHPFMKCWQPLGAETTASGSLLHPGNERHLSFNSDGTYIFCNEDIAQMFTLITEFITALICNIKLY
jgi:hypothetical protein